MSVFSSLQNTAREINRRGLRDWYFGYEGREGLAPTPAQLTVIAAAVAAIYGLAIWRVQLPEQPANKVGNAPAAVRPGMGGPTVLPGTSRCMVALGRSPR